MCEPPACWLACTAAFARHAPGIMLACTVTKRYLSHACFASLSTRRSSSCWTTCPQPAASLGARCTTLCMRCAWPATAAACVPAWRFSARSDHHGALEA